MENNLNCSLRLLMSNSMLETCNITEFGLQDQRRLQKLVINVTQHEEREIFEMTGCKPGCSKSKFELSLSELQEQIDNGREVAKIQLTYPHGEYEVTEEYYVYDMDSFIPDVGGYMGLLLGYSLLSMYHMFTQCLLDYTQWLLNLKLVKLFVTKKTSGNEEPN